MKGSVCDGEWVMMGLWSERTLDMWKRCRIGEEEVIGNVKRGRKVERGGGVVAEDDGGLVVKEGLVGEMAAAIVE